MQYVVYDAVRKKLKFTSAMKRMLFEITYDIEHEKFFEQDTGPSKRISYIIFKLAPLNRTSFVPILFLNLHIWLSIRKFQYFNP